MAKFFGKIGFIETDEFVDGVWKPKPPVERDYYGDVRRDSKRFEPGEKVNDDLTVNNELSILADTFAIQNFYKIRYVRWMGTTWKVNNVTVEFPRLILTNGGLYNGEQAGIAEGTRECSC